MGTITLIRHGQASFGKANYDELSELGQRQGRELGQWLDRAGIRLDHIVTGRLRRHRQTAEAACTTLRTELQPGSDWQVEGGFDEYDHNEMLLRHEPRFGDPAFLRALFQEHPNPRQEFQSIFVAAFARWMSGEHDADYRESWRHFKERCITAVKDLAASNPERGRHIAVFTSGGPITAITQSLLDLPDHQVARLNSSIANGSLTKILFQPGRLSLSTLNSYAHFEQAGDSSLITYR